MKWIFLAGLLLLTPMLVAFLNSNRRHLPLAAFFLGMLPFIESRFNVSASPIAWPAWPGISKGIELSLTDAVAIAILVAGAKVRTPLALTLAIALYAFAFLLSYSMSVNKMAASFYAWNFGRALLVYFAVARASMADNRVPASLLSGLIAGLAVQGAVVAYQYAGGASQAGGWFGHQNILGMTSHFIVYPALAAFLGGYYRKRTALAVLAGVIVAFAGGSRATIGLLIVGMILTVALSYWHAPSGRKASIAAAAVFGVLVISPILYSAIERRSPESRASSNEQRRAMMNAAKMIIADNPFGVGANSYVVVSNVGGYSARANVAWNMHNRAAPVHNTYYLVTAEMGWIGLLGLLAVLAALIKIAFWTLRKADQSFGGEYSVGIATCILMLAVHSYVEWVNMTYPIHVLLAMNVGVLVAIRAAVLDRQRALLRPTAKTTVAPRVEGPAASVS